MINGLFQTDYATDSIIKYNWTEFEDNELRRILADTILTINDTNSYHMKAQMTDDENIIFRVFEYVLKLNFGSQGSFLYKVTTFKFLETSLEELNQKKMVILIPFQLLKLRKLLEKERSDKNLNALKNLIQNDIIGSINKNLELGNITLDDAQKLRRLTHKLYEHIYPNHNFIFNRVGG